MFSRIRILQEIFFNILRRKNTRETYTHLLFAKIKSVDDDLLVVSFLCSFKSTTTSLEEMLLLLSFDVYGFSFFCFMFSFFFKIISPGAWRSNVPTFDLEVFT